MRAETKKMNRRAATLVFFCIQTSGSQADTEQEQRSGGTFKRAAHRFLHIPHLFAFRIASFQRLQHLPCGTGFHGSNVKAIVQGLLCMAFQNRLGQAALFEHRFVFFIQHRNGAPFVRSKADNDQLHILLAKPRNDTRHRACSFIAVGTQHNGLPHQPVFRKSRKRSTQPVFKIAACSRCAERRKGFHCG